MKDIRLLKEVVSGVPAITKKDISGTDARGQRHIDKSEQWLANNKNKDSMLTLRGWRSSVGDGWEYTDNNVDYKNKTELDLLAKAIGSEDKAKAMMIEDYRNKLNALGNSLAQEHKIQDDIKYMPEWIREDVIPFYLKTSAGMTDRNLRNARLTKREQAFKTARLTEGMLAEDVSKRIHREDAEKLDAMGLPIHIDTETGRFATVQDGQLVPAFAIDMPEMSLTEEFLMHDTRDVWDNRIDELLFKSRQREQETHKKLNDALWHKLTSSSIPEEFKPGVVVDAAENNGWDMQYVYEGVDRLMDDAFQKGMFKRPGDAARYYREQFNNIANHAKRRMES